MKLWLWVLITSFSYQFYDLVAGLVNYVEEDFVKTNHKAIEIANNIILKVFYMEENFFII